MRHILLDSLFLALQDLLIKRLAALECFGAGAAAKKLLVIQRDKIAALPAALTGRPLADELSATDERHDGIGAAIWFLTEAYLRHPATKPDLIEAIKKIRAAFITGLDELMATYEAEATAAKGRKDSVADLEVTLKSIPVVDGTLYDWVVSFLAEGETLDDLLSKRADAKDRKAAAQLRTELLGMLTRLRKNLAAELKVDSSLPADLDAQVFGYFDLLETKAAEAATAKKQAETKKKGGDPGDPGAPPGPPAPPAPPGGGGGTP